MSLLGNSDIERNVNLLVEKWKEQSFKGTQITAEEELMIEAGTNLFINVLQNLNDIAYALSNLDVTLTNHRG